MKKTDACELCDGTEIVRRRVRTTFHFMGKTTIIDDVPAWVCTQCGEKYFDAPVYKRLERIARNRGLVRKTIRFPLATYNMALP